MTDQDMANVWVIIRQHGELIQKMVHAQTEVVGLVAGLQDEVAALKRRLED